jgi:hypothetical protein
MVLGLLFTRKKCAVEVIFFLAGKSRKDVTASTKRKKEKESDIRKMHLLQT